MDKMNQAMKSEISSGTLTAVVNHYGAELCSLKNKAGIEFIWQADNTIWPRHSPILFPIVGRLKNDSYNYNGSSFSMSQHGFARDKVFELISQSSNKITLSLKADTDTFKKYPFNFELLITYLLDENSLGVSYFVTNIGEAIMPFSIGAHPGFCCPIDNNEQFEDYEIIFSENENLEIALLQNGLFNGDKKLLSANCDRIKLNGETFLNDALVFENLKSQFVALQSKKSNRYVKLSLKGFPYLGIWSKPGAPFVCIEPWCGKADSLNASGNIIEKEGIIAINPVEIFNCSFTIYVG